MSQAKYVDRAVGSSLNPNSLAARLDGAERLPLELALSVATEVVEAVAAAHQRKLVFGHLAARDFVVSPEGAIAIIAATAPDAEPAADTFEVGSLLFQVFTGLTPSQACERLQVDTDLVPGAASINPAVDDGLSAMLSQMLSREPTQRPHSLRVVEGVLSEVCESLEVEPSRAAVLRWADAARPAVAVPDAVVAPQPDAEVAPKSLAEWVQASARMPLELALSLATEVVEVVASAHQRRVAFGQLGTKDFVVGPEGVEVTAAATAGADPAGDTLAVGAVLFELFTGLTTSQASEQLKVDLNTVPRAATINPTLDEGISDMLSQMLSSDAAQRPYSLRVVECQLGDACERLGVETSRSVILGWPRR